MGDRVNGIVKWFNNERGYGFIYEGSEEEEGATEYFVHYSSIKMDKYKTLKAGQHVTFEVKETDKGTQATEVEVVG